MLYIGMIIAATMMPTAMPIITMIIGSIRVIRLARVLLISRL